MPRKTGTKKVQFSIYMDSSLKANLENISSAQGISLSELLEDLGRAYYEGVPQEALRQLEQVRQSLSAAKVNVLPKERRSRQPHQAAE
jgi:hypothetical protein